MLNPSTADAEIDDPTIRRCVQFARDNNYGSLVVVNLFALRSTDPKALLTAEDPEGPRNLDIIGTVCNNHMTVAAWGSPKNDRIRSQVLRATAKLRGPLFCLGTTKDGSPRHPLYVKRAQKFEVWREYRPV